MSVPSRTGTVGDLARMLARLVGPGIDAPDNSLAAADYLALGDALAETDTTTTNSGLDAFPSYAVNLLTEWERILGLPTDTSLSDDARRTALTARTRALFGGSPQRLLRAIQVYATEATIAEATLPTGAFRFGVVVNTTTFASAAKVSAIDAKVAVMKPAHTRGRVTTGVIFRTADVTPGNPLAGRLDDTLLGS